MNKRKEKTNQRYSVRRHPRDEDKTMTTLRDSIKRAALKYDYPVPFDIILDLIDDEIDRLCQEIRKELLEDIVYEDARKLDRFVQGLD